MANTVNAALKPLETLSRIVNQPSSLFSSKSASNKNKNEQDQHETTRDTNSNVPDTVDTSETEAHEEDSTPAGVTDPDIMDGETEADSVVIAGQTEGLNPQEMQVESELVDLIDELLERDAGTVNSTIIGRNGEDESQEDVLMDEAPSNLSQATTLQANREEGEEGDEDDDDDGSEMELDEDYPDINTAPHIRFERFDREDDLIIEFDNMFSTARGHRDTTQFHSYNNDVTRILVLLGPSAAADILQLSSSLPLQSRGRARLLVGNDDVHIIARSDDELLDDFFHEQSATGGQAGTLSNIPTALTRWTDECKVLDAESMHDCVAVVKVPIIQHLESLRDEELEERREKRRKQLADEEEAKQNEKSSGGELEPGLQGTGTHTSSSTVQNPTDVDQPQLVSSSLDTSRGSEGYLTAPPSGEGTPTAPESLVSLETAVSQQHPIVELLPGDVVTEPNLDSSAAVATADLSDPTANRTTNEVEASQMEMSPAPTIERAEGSDALTAVSSHLEGSPMDTSSPASAGTLEEPSGDTNVTTAGNSGGDRSLQGGGVSSVNEPLREGDSSVVSVSTLVEGLGDGGSQAAQTILEEPLPSTSSEEEDPLAGINLPEGVDPSFLAALPEDIRREVLQNQLGIRPPARPVPTATVPTPTPALVGSAGVTEVSPEFLAALPPAIQEEVLAQQRAEQQRRELSQAATGDTPMDPVTFIQTLPSDLRRSVLEDMEDSVLAVMPPDIAAEAQALRREQEARQRQLMHERLFGHSGSSALSAILRSPAFTSRLSGNRGVQYTRLAVQRGPFHMGGSGSHNRPSSSNVDSLLRLRGRLLLDHEALSCLLVLLFVDEPKLNTSRLHRVLRNLCYHMQTRNWVIRSLLSILQRSSESELCIESPRLASVGGDERGSKRPTSVPGSGVGKGIPVMSASSSLELLHKMESRSSSQLSWLSVSMDAALGCRTNIFQIQRSAGRKHTERHAGCGSTVHIHPQAAPVVCRHVLDTLIQLAKVFPSHFTQQRPKDPHSSENDGKERLYAVGSGGGKPLTGIGVTPPCQATHPPTAFSNPQMQGLGISTDFWDLLVKLDNMNVSRKGKASVKSLPVGGTGESEGTQCSLEASPLGQLMNMLSHPVIRRSSLLTEKLLRLLSLISIALPDNKATEVPVSHAGTGTPAVTQPVPAGSTTTGTTGITSVSTTVATAVTTTISASTTALSVQKPSRSSAIATQDSSSTSDKMASSGLTEKQLQLSVEVLTSHSCSEEGLEDAANILLQLSRGDAGTRDTVLKLLLTGARQLGYTLCKQIGTSSLGSASSIQAAVRQLEAEADAIIQMPEAPAVEVQPARRDESPMDVDQPSPSGQEAPSAESVSTSGSSVPAEREEKVPELPLLSEQLLLDELWDMLGECLKELEESHDQHAVLVLQPAVEAFFLVHATERESKPPVRDTRESQLAHIKDEPPPLSPAPLTPATPSSLDPFFSREPSSMHISSSLPPDTQKFLRFAETHRTVLNQILRQSTTHLADGPFAVLVDYIRILDFDVKRKYFRQELERLDEGLRKEDMAVHVRRDHVFEDSYRELHRKSPEEMKNRLYIVFEGEEGQDAGGLLREWYMIISREMFNPMYALFRTSPGDRVTYTINPSSHCNPNHLSYFKFVGRVVAKAVYDNRLLECYFTRSFYKHILGKSVRYTDMESEDYHFYQGLVYLLENDVSTLGYELTFSTEVQEFGVCEVRDLKPNGANILVTEENKKEYVHLVCQMKMTGAIRKQLAAFLEGFYEIIPKRLISIFTEQELELLISGLPTIDIDDLKANTEYHKYQSSSIQIQWFWRALRSFDQADRAKFLQFVTGTSKVPLQGFAALEGMNGIQKFQIHRDDRSTDRLPSAHTCFNQLDLPAYESYEKLRHMLLLAIQECSEGFGLA
ncbi:HUWE1 ligase, partial [Polypterus senegalus]